MMQKLSQQGFTLIELMTVVAIVALLAAIAFPSYQDQITKSRRAEAPVTLLEAAQGLERCFTRFSAYDSDDCAIAQQLGGAGIDSEERWYTVTTTAIGPASFTLSAAPQRVQVDDTDCSAFTFDNLGVRGVTGSTSAADCW